MPDAIAEVASITAALGFAVTMLEAEFGKVRPGNDRGHEHFGFLDGFSQPALAGLGLPFPGQRLVDAGRFVFGYPNAPTAPEWMNNGSFMVLHRLAQLVPEFESTLGSEGDRLEMDAELLGARIMGRWRSGVQIADTPLQDEAQLGTDPFIITTSTSPMTRSSVPAPTARTSAS